MLFQERTTRSNLTQFVRYGVVGASLNLFGYLIYLVVTWLGMEPKMVVTVFYPLSVLYGYFAHKRFSFRYAGNARNYRTVARYILVYAIGYVINVCLIAFFHDRLGYRHQIVQAAAIFVVAGFLFVMMKLFVFHVRLQDRYP